MSRERIANVRLLTYGLGCRVLKMFIYRYEDFTVRQNRTKYAGVNEKLLNDSAMSGFTK